MGRQLNNPGQTTNLGLFVFFWFEPQAKPHLFTVIDKGPHNFIYNWVFRGPVCVTNRSRAFDPTKGFAAAVQ